jgi:hypothetical protein
MRSRAAADASSNCWPGGPDHPIASLPGQGSDLITHISAHPACPFSTNNALLNLGPACTAGRPRLRRPGRLFARYLALHCQQPLHRRRHAGMGLVRRLLGGCWRCRLLAAWSITTNILARNTGRQRPAMTTAKFPLASVTKPVRQIQPHGNAGLLRYRERARYRLPGHRRQPRSRGGLHAGPACRPGPRCRRR